MEGCMRSFGCLQRWRQGREASETLKYLTETMCWDANMCQALWFMEICALNHLGALSYDNNDHGFHVM